MCVESVVSFQERTNGKAMCCGQEVAGQPLVVDMLLRRARCTWLVLCFKHRRNVFECIKIFMFGYEMYMYVDNVDTYVPTHFANALCP